MNERAHLYTLPYSIYPVTHRHDQILNDLDYEEAAETLAYLHEKYNDKVPPFGGNGLGAFVFARTYSRVNSDGQMEDWNDVVYRCMTGWLATMFWHIRRTFPGSDGGVERTGRMLRCIDEAHDMYDGFFDMRWMPPGRGLWTGGTELLRRSATPGQNCSAVSTGNGDPLELVKRLGRIMDLLMCGCGVGSDLKASSHNNENAPTILNPWADGRATVKFIVPDTREGWVLAYQAAIAPFFLPDEPLRAFDYGSIRKEGVVLKNMGGVSSGPGPLMDLIATAARRLTDEVGTKLGVTLLADLINILGKCTSMGNIRRAAEIIVGPEDSLEFFQLKDWNLNPQRGGWAWASNNSPGITCPDWEPSEAYLCNVLERGEPGAIFLVNTQEWARAHEPNDGDCAVCLYQPCQPACAPILTPRGIRTLGEVGVGDVIWSKSGWTTIKAKWSTGTKQVNRYETSAGYFLGTENHRIVQRGVKVPVGEATHVDHIAGCVAGVSWRDADPQWVLDGLMIGDGSARARGGLRPILYIGKDDQDYFSEEGVRDLITVSGDKRGTLAYAQTGLADAELSPIIARRIPERYVTAEPAQVCAFLRGLFSANGCVVRHGGVPLRVQLKQTSHALIQQAQLMLSSIGITSRINRSIGRDVKFANGEYRCRDSFALSIQDAHSFQRMIGFIQSHKSDRLQALVESRGEGVVGARSKTPGEINSVVDMGRMEVFDITVDNESHTYWTGGLNVSNCGEMPQEDGETCNLAEVILDRNTADQLYLSARHAYLWCKAQTLLNHHDPAVDKVVKSVRRIGVGITGLVNWLNNQTIGLGMAAKTLDIMHVEVRELDRWWSDYMGCPESRRLCTSKPSGTVSLLPYTTPGVHDDEAPYIIRRVQVSSMSPLWRQAQGAGYPVEMRRLQNGELDPSTMVVSFPLDTGAQRRKAEIGMQEQLDRAAMVARSWSDNAVSVTINIPPHEQTIEHLRAAVMFAKAHLKTVSFLPMDTHGYVQAPLEEITEETYRELMRGITPPVVWRSQHETTDAGCDAGGCAVPQR